MTVTLLSKPGCVPCLATKRAFAAKGIEYTEVDITEDVEALELAKNLGHMQAPVVVVNGGETHWSGFRPDRISELSA
jgi:glutaredoxin-like protein NrdH